jgi:hypothetical protein
VLERVRMCVAEAGYDPDLVIPTDLDGFVFEVIGDLLPFDVCWKARELSGVGAPKCRRCTAVDRRTRYPSGCRATDRFEWNCGRFAEPGGIPGFPDPVDGEPDVHRSGFEAGCVTCRSTLTRFSRTAVPRQTGHGDHTKESACVNEMNPRTSPR